MLCDCCEQPDLPLTPTRCVCRRPDTFQLCADCRTWVLGRITCPWHGDD